MRRFIARLPRDGKEELAKASRAVHRVGAGVLEHSRNRTFHYPYPASRYQTEQELENALRELREEEPMIVPHPSDPGREQGGVAALLRGARTGVRTAWLRRLSRLGYPPRNIRPQLRK